MISSNVFLLSAEDTFKYDSYSCSNNTHIFNKNIVRKMTNKVYLKEIQHCITHDKIHIYRADIGLLVKVSPNFHVELTQK